MQPQKIRRVGNSLGLTLPKEMVSRLGVHEGDSVYISEAPNGINITTTDPDFERAMEAYRIVAAQYRDAFHELGR